MGFLIWFYSTDNLIFSSSPFSKKIFRAVKYAIRFVFLKVYIGGLFQMYSVISYFVRAIHYMKFYLTKTINIIKFITMHLS